MRHFLGPFILLLLLLGFTSCAPKGKKNTTTSLRLFAAANSNISLLSGGVMVYGHNLDTQGKFARRVMSNQDVVDLSNGDWKFWAIAWSGDSNSKAFEGTVYCSNPAPPNARLDGGDASVELVISATRCSAPLYGTSDFRSGSQFKPLSIVDCSYIGGIVDGDSSCTSTPSESGSYKIILPQFGDASILSPNLEVCVTDASATSRITTTSLLLPSIDGQQDFFGTHIIAFKNSDCTGESNPFHFDHGLNTQPSGSSLFFNGSNSVVFLETYYLPSPAGAMIYPVAGMSTSTETNFQFRAQVGRVLKQSILSGTNFKFHTNNKAYDLKPNRIDGTAFTFSLGTDH
jgi:hypothetical protein